MEAEELDAGRPATVFDDNGTKLDAAPTAWNHSQQDRLVSLFDFRRPGLQHTTADVPPRELQRFVSRQVRGK